LLGDGRCPDQPWVAALPLRLGAGAFIASPGFFQRVPLKPLVLQEKIVFRDDDGALQVNRDAT
jgi:hypothetical protein